MFATKSAVREAGHESISTSEQRSLSRDDGNNTHVQTKFHKVLDETFRPDLIKIFRLNINRNLTHGAIKWIIYKNFIAG